MTNGVQPAGTSPTYRVVRELGKRVQRSWAAVREKNELVVIQRFTKATRPPSAFDDAYDKNGVAYVAADALGLILRDARCLSKNWHPNVSRVRHVDLSGNELTIATELVEGVTLADLITAALAKRTNEKEPILALPLLARVIVDVLGGLHGLHGLRDSMNAPLNAFHAELCPANIIVGKDGVARIAHVFRARPVKIDPRSEGLGYASPETLAGEITQDARADIYAVGTILWEGLTGKRLYEDTDPVRVAQRQREEDLASPNLPSSSAFARLSDVATRALAFDPALRFRSASEMATEIRRIAGTRLAPGSAVAQTVLELSGDRIRTRRAELDPNSSGARRAFGAASMPPPAAPAKKPVEPDTVTTVASTTASDPPTTTTRAPTQATKIGLPKPSPNVPKVAPKPSAAPAPPAVTVTTSRDTVESAPDLLGPRGSDPNIVDVPLVAPNLATLARAASTAKPNGDALAMAAAMEVAVAEKSLFDSPMAQPPPAPFPMTPSAAPPSWKRTGQPEALIVMPKLGRAPFPLTPSARPPAPEPPPSDPVPIGAPSERIDVTSVDLIEARPDLAPPDDSVKDVAARESNGAEPVAAMSLGSDDAASDSAIAARRKKIAPLFAAIAGVLALILVVAGIASLTGSNESKDPPKREAKTTSAATTTTTETATASATVPAPPPTVVETATAAPPPAPTPEPAPEPAAEPAPKPVAAAKPSPPPPVAQPAPRPASPPAPTVKKPKKSYDPSGI